MKGNPRKSWILDSTPWILDSRYWIPDSLSLERGFRILELNSEFQFSKSRIPDCASKKSWIPNSSSKKIHELRNPEFFSWSEIVRKNHRLKSFRLKEFVVVLKALKRSNVEPTYNERPRDWQNLFAVSRFRYIRFFFIYFTITGLKKIVCYTEDIVM